jgi:hypothetical protein
MPTVVVRSKAFRTLGYGGIYSWAREGRNTGSSISAPLDAVGQLWYQGQFECLQANLIFDTRFLEAELTKGGSTTSRVTGARLSAVCLEDASDTDFTLEARAVLSEQEEFLGLILWLIAMFPAFAARVSTSWMFIPGTELSSWPLAAHRDMGGFSGVGSFDFVNDSLISNVRTDGFTILSLSSARQRLNTPPSGREWVSIDNVLDTPTLTITYGEVVSREVFSSVLAAASLRQAIVTTANSITANSVVAGANEAGTKYGFVQSGAIVWEGATMVLGIIATAEIAPLEGEVTSGFSPDFSGLAVL